MTTNFIFIAAFAGIMASCGESSTLPTENEREQTETNQLGEGSTTSTPEELAAINDETRPSEGAIECLTQQYALVKEGKFTEALEYYSARIRAKVEAQLAKNPEITKDWQAATNRTKEDFDVIVKSVRENPNSFVFENGMWRMDQR